MKNPLKTRSIRGIAILALATVSLMAGNAASGQDSDPLLISDTFDRDDIAPWTTKFLPAQFTIVQGQLRGEHLDPGHSATGHNFYVPVGDLRFSFHARLEGVKGFTMHVGDSEAMDRAHFGHVAHAQFRGGHVRLSDDFTGLFKKEHRSLPPEERRKVSENMMVRPAMPFAIDDGEWHYFTMEFRGNLARVFVDGQLVAEHRSEGFAHPTKNRISLNVLEGVAYFDNVEVIAL